MMDRAVSGHSVPLILQRFFTVTSCCICTLRCHIIVTWQVQICLLMGHFSFFVPLLVFTAPPLCYSCLFQLVTGDITLAFPSWTKDDQCCATLPAAHSTHWQSRLVMMQCEVTDSSVCVSLMGNDRLIFFCDAGFHSTGQRFQGKETESIFRILTMSCPFTLMYYIIYCVLK